jgi:hypothetical protein
VLAFPLPASNFLPFVFLLQLLLAFFCLYWKCLLGFQDVKFNCDCTSGFTGHFCLLPTVQVQLQLYFLTTQAVVVFYQLKFNCSCTSLTTQAQLCTTNSSSTFFKFNWRCTSLTTQAQLCTTNSSSTFSLEFKVI